MRYWHRITFAQSSHWMTVTRRHTKPLPRRACCIAAYHSSDALAAVSTSIIRLEYRCDVLAAEVKVSKVKIFTFSDAANAICKMNWTYYLFQMPRSHLTPATEPINYNFFFIFSNKKRFSFFRDTSQAAIKHRIIILCNFVWLKNSVRPILFYFPFNLWSAFYFLAIFFVHTESRKMKRKIKGRLTAHIAHCAHIFSINIGTNAPTKWRKRRNA